MIAHLKNGQVSLRRLALLTLFSFVLVAGIAPFEGFGLSASASTQYNNVQVFIQTQSNNELGPYTLVAYNSSGSLISSSQSNYPAFSLELPSGTYLFAVTAVNQSSTEYYWWSYSTEEYGYQLVQISSSTTLNLKTTPLQDIGTSKIAIQAKYVNGSLVLEPS